MEPNTNALQLAVASLSGNHSFHAFLDAINDCREVAVRDASHLDLIESPHKLASLMGEVRAYQQILDIYKDLGPVD